jgi:hypothetical protein
VGAYSGYFFAADAGVNTPQIPVIPNAGVVGIAAAPLDNDQNLNPNGIFATYFGISGGAGGNFFKVAGADIAVTNYVFLGDVSTLIGLPRIPIPDRFRYGSPLDVGNGFSVEDGYSSNYQDQITERQRSLWRRSAAAAVMSSEIATIGGGLIGNPMADFAIAKLWSFVWRP